MSGGLRALGHFEAMGAWQLAGHRDRRNERLPMTCAGLVSPDLDRSPMENFFRICPARRGPVQVRRLQSSNADKDLLHCARRAGAAAYGWVVSMSLRNQATRTPVGFDGGRSFAQFENKSRFS